MSLKLFLVKYIEIVVRVTLFYFDRCIALFLKEEQIFIKKKKKEEQIIYRSQEEIISKSSKLICRLFFMISILVLAMTL